MAIGKSCIAARDGVGQAVQFFLADRAAGLALNAAVETKEQPVTHFLVGTVGKRRARTNGAHQITNVVIARDAVNSQLECQHEVPEVRVRALRVVMDEVAGREHPVRAPIGRSVMIENPLQRVGRPDAAQFAARVGEQVRVRQVQDPYRIIGR